MSKSMTFMDGILDMISSKVGSISSKRVVGIFAFIYCFIAGIADLFFNYTPTEFVFFGILGLVVSLFGLSTYSSQKIGKLEVEKEKVEVRKEEVEVQKEKNDIEKEKIDVTKE